MSWQGMFKGKKITVMGLGLLGRAVNDAKFLAQEGAELIITDLKADDDLRESLEVLKPYPSVRYRLGGHARADFCERDYILKAAGVPLDSPYIAEARKNKIPIKMSASWFAKLAQAPMVGVTGTRGKSTVTYMLYDIMRASHLQVLLGGNIRGVSTLALLPHVTKDSIALMELDSWQCRGFGDEKLSPNVAVFTTFMDDHLNYYKGDRNAYLDDKAQIFVYQKPEDTLVISEQAVAAIGKYKSVIKAKVVVAKPGKIKLQVPGVHNRLNAACALEAARALGIDDEISKKALTEFKGVPGRLELVRERNGVKYYNDTTATTPDATLAALEALGTERTILIMGGADKGLDMAELIARLPELKAVLILAGTGTDRIKPLVEKHVMYDAFSEAVLDAAGLATPGDSVLLSPGFASFGMFKNEFDRGDQFTAMVRGL